MLYMRSAHMPMCAQRRVLVYWSTTRLPYSLGMESLTEPGAPNSGPHAYVGGTLV